MCSQAAGKIDRVYSAAQDSDFLVYDGMGDIIYDLKSDGSFHSIMLERDVLGQVVGQYNFTKWHRWQFVIFSAACGCDYIDNPTHWGAAKLYKLVSENLAMTEDALISLVASKATDAAAYRDALTNAVLSFRHHVVFEEAADGSVRQVHLSPLPPSTTFITFEELPADACEGVMHGTLDPISLGARTEATETNVDDADQPELEADFTKGKAPAQFSAARLKAWLVNRGIPVPSLLKSKGELVELVKLALSFPDGAWGVISPWHHAMHGWTRPDPVTLDARDPLCGQDLWQLVRSEEFPTVADEFVHKLMPPTWANTLDRGRLLYADGMCYVNHLSLQFGSDADGTPVWMLRMPVRASMRSQRYESVRVCVSATRPYLAPSSGCECENACIACSHQVALLMVVMAVQESESWEAYQASVRSFSAETLASGAVHWWHLLFRRGRRRRKGAKAVKGMNLRDSVRELGVVAHPFVREHELLASEDSPDDLRPLYAPGSSEHAAYIARLVGSGCFSEGMLSQVVALDPG